MRDPAATQTNTVALAVVLRLLWHLLSSAQAVHMQCITAVLASTQLAPCKAPATTHPQHTHLLHMSSRVHRILCTQPINDKKKSFEAFTCCTCPAGPRPCCRWLGTLPSKTCRRQFKGFACLAGVQRVCTARQQSSAWPAAACAQHSGCRNCFLILVHISAVCC